MSLTKGLVLAERPHIGNTAPTTFEDTSRFGNDGVETAITKVQLASGLWVNSFNGSTSQIVTPQSNSLRLQDTFTWLLWAKAIDAGVITNPGIIASGIEGTDSFLSIENDRLEVFISATGFTRVNGAITVLDGVWTFCGVTFDNSLGSANIKLYVNAVADVTGNETDDLSHDNNTVLLGRYSIQYFGGQGALAKSYNRALSPQEIADIFESERRFFGV